MLWSNSLILQQKTDSACGVLRQVGWAEGHTLWTWYWGPCCRARALLVNHSLSWCAGAGLYPSSLVCQEQMMKSAAVLSFHIVVTRTCSRSQDVFIPVKRGKKPLREKLVPGLTHNHKPVYYFSKSQQRFFTSTQTKIKDETKLGD